MKHTVTFDIEVPEDWIEFLVRYSDLFGSNYCGYWLRGIEHDSDGWIAWEHNDQSLSMSAETEMLAAWRAGCLMPGFFRIDRAMAIKAYIEGVKRWGVDWYKDGDGPRYDVVVQMALLGEVRYG